MLSLVAALISALPVGMWPLAVVLGVLDRGGSVADAGLLAAVFGVGNAIGIVSQGALLLRLRPSRLLAGFAVFGVLAAWLLTGAGPAAVIGAVLAGIAIPAVTPAVRGGFATVLPSDDRPGAYALVNMLFQAGIAVGPITVAALATAGLIHLAGFAAAAGGVIAAVLLAIAQRRQGVHPVGPRPVTAGGASSRTGIPVLLLTAAAGGFGIGVLQVLVPAQGGAVVAGAAFAALALAEVAGAVVAGGRLRPVHAPKMLVVGTAVMAMCYVGIATGTALLSPLAIVPLAIVLGLATAVQSLGSSLSLDRFVSPRRLPAVFSLQIAVLISGAALGSLVGGARPDVAPAIAAALLVLAVGGGLLLPRPVRAGEPRSARLRTP